MKQLTQKQVTQYFNRVGYSGPIFPSETFLRDLVWKHATTIPFEGLAIHLGDKVEVDDIEKIFEKIVNHHRGGWCYEMNGLFFYILQSLKFNVKLHLASVYEDKWLPPSHSFLVVELDGKNYLTDVGFGNMGLVEPIELRASNQIKMMKNGINYKLTESTSGEYLYSAGFNEKISQQYRFKLTNNSLSLDDLVVHNEAVSTIDDSPFVKNVVAKIATTQGFRKLVNKKYTEYEIKGSKMETVQSYVISSKNEYLLVLKEKFGIILPPNRKLSSLFEESG